MYKVKLINEDSNFNKWLDTFIDEKGINTDESFTVEGKSGTNFMTIETVIEAMKATSSAEQGRIKDMLVKLDFQNQKITPYLKHLAQAIAR